MTIKKVVAGKRYFFMQDSTVNGDSSMNDPNYRCRQCAAFVEVPNDGRHLTNEGYLLHNRLRVYTNPLSGKACEGGYWVRDTEQAKFKAITRMLERA